LRHLHQAFAVAETNFEDEVARIIKECGSVQTQRLIHV